VSLSEFFSLEVGENLEKQLYGACRKLGFDFVFDASLGADLTTITEAEELLERVQEENPMPLFTSCCPAWVRFVQKNYPQFISSISTTRSPHMQA